LSYPQETAAMSADEPTGTPAAETEAGTATATAPEGTPAKLTQAVDIRDAGPCRKHIKVTVERKDIDDRLNAKFSELALDQRTPQRGFRPGKTPRKLIERRYGKDVSEQVKAEVLMASLEQLAQEHQLQPLSPPDINPDKIVFPKDGPLVYEFEVEVAPSFETPQYKGLKLRRPVKQFSDADIEKEERRLLESAGQLVPKDGAVELGDVITADLVVKDGDRELQNLKEVRVKVEPRIAFNDASAEDFGAQIIGAKAGETRTVTLKLADSMTDESLRGKDVQATFTISDVKTYRLPEINEELLESFGARSHEQLRELIRTALERRLEYTQRQSAREQVLAQISESATWDLPRDLLIRQSRKALARRVMEMRNAGMSEEEIVGREKLLQQDALRSTASSLKEHFVLQRIAEVEKVDVSEDDIEDEIERMSRRSDESPRRIRARLEREDLIETLATELLERKVMDLILDSAEYEDVPLDAAQQPAPVSSVEAEVAPGSAEEPTAPPAAE
jgi:trigger factor